MAAALVRRSRVTPRTLSRQLGRGKTPYPPRRRDRVQRATAALAVLSLQIEALPGPVAVRVRGAVGARELFGAPLPCRDDRGRTRECTGLVRVDLRQYDRVDVRRDNAPLSVAATAGAVSLAAIAILYAALYVAWIWAVEHAE